MVGVGTREPARSALTEIGSVTNPKGETMIQLVKYDCGCIGTPPYTDETHEEKSHIIIDCTGHMDEPRLMERDMAGKTYALLPVDDYYKKIIASLVELISLGYAAKRIQVELSYIKLTLTPKEKQ